MKPPTVLQRHRANALSSASTCNTCHHHNQIKPDVILQLAEQNKVQADQIRRLKSMLASKFMNRKEHVETLKERLADKMRVKQQDEKLSRRAQSVWRMMKDIVARKMKINKQAEMISMQQSKIKRLTKLWRLSVKGAYELRKENDKLVDERLDFEGRMENAARERRVLDEAWGLCVGSSRRLDG